MTFPRKRRHAAEERYDHLVKILLLGDSSVGKSSLLLRFTENRFETEFLLTIGVDFKTKTITSGRQRLKLQLWDTAGQERFRTITPAYFRSAMGIILVYDVSNAMTFRNVARWMRDVEEFAGAEVERVIVGNKADLDKQRQVAYEDGVQLAAEYAIPFVETSAKLNANVDLVFRILADRIRLARFPDEPGEVPAPAPSNFAAEGRTPRSIVLTGEASQATAPHAFEGALPGSQGTELQAALARRRCCGG
eukprot:GHVT01090874.1.p1 GENE.GHVT01090874.1~~GHVT01090874.1.p1  ORF type:complete len:249 (+),score=58.41 GHVT01090874.1:291-1037(+)